MLGNSSINNIYCEYRESRKASLAYTISICTYKVEKRERIFSEVSSEILRDLNVKESQKRLVDNSPYYCNYLITVIDTCYIIIFIELSINLSGQIVSKTSRKLVLVNSSTTPAKIERILTLILFFPTAIRNKQSGRQTICIVSHNIKSFWQLLNQIVCF